MPEPAPTLDFFHVTKRYRDFTLGPLSLEIGRGIVGLLGANGAGKSTFLGLAAGTVRATDGKVSVTSGQRKVGYLPQDFTAPRGAKVSEYLRYIAWCRSTRRRRFGRAEALAAAQRVDLADRWDSRVSDLSGGMVRRLGVAQALIHAPSVLLLDEPTVGLDPVQRQELRALLSDLSRENAMVVSTHLSEDIAAIADSVLVLDHGKLIHQGTVSSLCRVGGDTTVSGPTVESGFLAAVRGAAHAGEASA